MKKFLTLLLFICVFLIFFTTAIYAVNPFVTHIYTADPSAHVFDNRVYVYPSHDKDNPTFFDMEDYHVFSSADLKQWVDHGVVLHVNDVPWASEYMWAPDCAFKNGKYYFYFPAKDQSGNFKIGVAINEKQSPAGPFTALENPIPGSSSVDPAVFVDDDGQAYMFYGGQGQGGRDGHGPLWVKLKNNMIEFDGTPQEITSGVDYWFEACWVHKKDGIYYLSYSTGQNTGSASSEIHYATSTNIAGPWTYRGLVIGMVSGWTNHHSFVKYKIDPFGKEYWYAFYHTSEMSGGIMEKRSICVDRLNYNGILMQEVTPTRNGFSTDAFSRIKAQFFTGQNGVQINEDISGTGDIVDIGKQVSHIQNNDYIYFNNVDFGSIGAIGFQATAATATTGGTIEIRDGSTTGTLLGTLTITNTTGWGNWETRQCTINRITGIKNIYLVFKGGSDFLFNLDWFKFIRPGGNIPVGYSVGLKSLNPNCIDNQGNIGEKYLCIDTDKGRDLCANRPAVGGAWERFSVLDYNYDDFQNNLIELNSSNNGKNLCNEGFNIPIKADGGDYRGTADNEVFYWISNSDGTISFKNLYSNYFLCTDTWEYGHGNNPAKVYDNRPGIGGIGEKFYCEIGDAPIGCIVAFKSLNPNCIDNQGSMGTKYLCIDTERGRDLCANRPAVGGAWEKFLVVDAGNGYIALKSLNNNQYLRCSGINNPINANGNSTIDSNSERFQWRNNGDGTVSLKNVQYNMFLCVDTTGGKPNNPAKTYSNRENVSDVSYSYEKFYCQVISE